MSGGDADRSLVASPEKSLCQLVRRAQRGHAAAWSAAVPGGLTSPQYAVLTVVAGYPHANLGVIGRAASLDKSTTADVVSRLVRHGWLRQNPEAPRGRTRSPVLTAPAEVALPTVTAQVLAVQEALLAPVSPARRGELIGLLTRVAYPDPADLPPDPTPGAPVLGLADTLTHLLWRAEQRSQRIWREAVGKAATPAQYAVFCALRRDRLDQRTIAGIAALDTSNAGDVVARLGQRGLVSVERHDGDRRRRLVALTPVALDLLRELTLRVERVHRELCAPLSEDEGRRLTNILHLVAVGVDPAAQPNATAPE